MPRQNSPSDLHREHRPAPHHRLRWHRDVARPGRPADPHATRRRHPVRAQHYRRRADLQAAERLSGLRIHAAVHRRGHGRRPGRPLPQRHRLKPFRGRCFRHRRPQALSQARQSHRRILPDLGIQHRLRAGGGPGVRSLEDGDEFPCGFGGSETSGSLCPGISQGIARGPGHRLSQTLSRPRRGQSRHSPGTSIDQQILEEALGGRPVSLPDLAP